MEYFKTIQCGPLWLLLWDYNWVIIEIMHVLVDIKFPAPLNNETCRTRCSLESIKIRFILYFGSVCTRSYGPLLCCVLYVQLLLILYTANSDGNISSKTYPQSHLLTNMYIPRIGGRPHLGHHWSRQWFITSLSLSHGLNKCCFMVNCPWSFGEGPPVSFYIICNNPLNTPSDHIKHFRYLYVYHWYGWHKVWLSNWNLDLLYFTKKKCTWPEIYRCDN